MGLWHSYVDIIEWCLREIHDLTGNFGLAIIVFTIILKTVLLPLTVKSIRSTAAMQELQPKIRELQKKHSKDRQRLSQETMKLYSEYRINPLAGCLPLLLQIPIFFGLYRAVTHISEGAGGFLWINDLSEADPYKILPILAGVFQFLQTRMMRPHNAPKSTDPQQQMMQTMMNFMPIMVVIFGWTFAAGPVLYWATQSAYSVVQQWFITGWGAMKDWLPWLPDLPEHRRLGHRKEPLQSFAGEGGEVQPTGFMARLQARTLDLEERQREREQQRGGQTGGQTPSRSRSKSSTKAQSQTQQQKSRANARAQQQQVARDEPEEQPHAGGPRIVRARQNAGGDSFDGNGAGGKRARRTRGQASVGDVSGASLDADIDASGQTRPSRRTKK